MTESEKSLAIKALVRRGITPIDVAAADADLTKRNGHRNFRGNVSQQKGNVKTGSTLEALRAKRRARLGA
jgi:hypothetical protein